MKVKKGERLLIDHARKGLLDLIAAEDFDSDEVEWYPVVVPDGAHVQGLTTGYEGGERLPCHTSLCTIKKVTS